MNNTLHTNSSPSLTNCTLPLAHGIALLTTNAVVSVLGTLGNLLVCVAVITNPSLRRPSNYPLFSLAIADLLVTMACEPVMITLLQRQMFPNDCSQGLRIGFVLIASFSSTASIVHLAAISVERLLRIEVRVTFTLAIAIILFTPSWFPMFIVSVISAPKPKTNPYEFARMWFWTVALSNSAMNFLIYGSKMRNFGDAYVEIFRKILSCAEIKSRPEMVVGRVRPREEKNCHTPKNNFYETRL